MCVRAYVLRTATASSLPFVSVWYLLPLRRVLRKKLTGSQLVKNFPAFYGFLRFVTAFTKARYMSLSWKITSYMLRGLAERFVTWEVFKEWVELLGHHSSNKVKDHPLSSVRDCLFNTFAPYCRPFLHPQPEDVPWSVDWVPLITVFSVWW
jgi:hypothetical protein